MNYAPFSGKPMVLETPIDGTSKDGKKTEDYQIWADEIKLLEGLVGSDRDTDEFRALAEALQARGRAERERIAAQVDRKKGKVVVAAAAKQAQGKLKWKKTKEAKNCDSCDEAEE